MADDKMNLLRQWVSESSRIVFFGGAGVSTESGIQDFRSVDGLYHQHFDVPPETILSASYFSRYPEAFFRFYREKMLCPDAKPNVTHRVLAAWERAGKLRSVVTQNIDGLHTQAGSQWVWELHGSMERNYCTRCGKRQPMSLMINAKGVPRCECGGIVRPDVVLYEEGLSQEVLHGAISDLADADMLIVGGTSLTVYPAAGLIDAYTGKRMVLINRDPTPGDGKAALLFHVWLGEVFAYFENA